MPGVDLRRERRVRHFSPALVVPSTVALTNRTRNPAAGLLGDFLREKGTGASQTGTSDLSRTAR